MGYIGLSSEELCKGKVA